MTENSYIRLPRCAACPFKKMQRITHYPSQHVQALGVSANLPAPGLEKKRLSERDSSVSRVGDRAECPTG